MKKEVKERLKASADKSLDEYRICSEVAYKLMGEQKAQQAKDAARYRKVKAMEPSKLEWIAWNAHDNEHFDRLIDEIVLDNKGE